MFFSSSGGSELLGGSRSDILRGIITETLSAAAREILAAVERTVAGYEEESSGLRRQLELLQPQVRLHRAGVEEGTEGLSPAWENWEGSTTNEEQTAPKTHPGVKGHLNPSRSVPPHKPQISNRQNLLSLQINSKDDSDVQGVEVKKEEREEFLIGPPDAEADLVTDGETRLHQRPVDSSDGFSGDPQNQLTGDQSFSVKQKSPSDGRITEDGAIYCKVCGFCFTLLEHLIQHSWDHVDGPDNTCGVCGKTSESAEELKEHVRNHQKVHSYPHCGQTLPSVPRLDTHVRKRTGQNRFSGDICNESFRQRTDLSQHRSTHSKERRHTCGVCGRCFKQEDALKLHRKTHQVRDGPFRCHVCFKSFQFRSQLTFHLTTHSQQRSFGCSVCNKSFRSNRDLKRHMSIHTTETPFKCFECGRCFKQKAHLTSHAKIHSGVKEFVCGVCGKAVSWRHHLIVHMRTHNGERPYKCTLCEKAFIQSHGLKAHMKSHQRHGNFSWSGLEQEPSAAGEAQTVETVTQQLSTDLCNMSFSFSSKDTI